MEGIEYTQGEDSATNAGMAQEESPPFQTLTQLTSMCTLLSVDGVADDDKICNICQEIYLQGPSPEYPLRLPSCKHVFGRDCIVAWINENKNTCPHCRKPILDIAAEEEDDDETESEEDHDDQHWRQELRQWNLSWDANEHGSHAPTAWALHGEELFSDLCEAIVSWIEHPSILHNPNPAEEWLCGREPFKNIIACATFRGFCALWEGPEEYIGQLALSLPQNLPDRTPFDLIMDHISTHDHNRRRQYMDANEQTHERMAEWYKRIRKSRNALARRLDAGSDYQIDSESDDSEEDDDDDGNTSEHNNVGHRGGFDEQIDFFQGFTSEFADDIRANARDNHRNADVSEYSEDSDAGDSEDSEEDHGVKHAPPLKDQKLMQSEGSEGVIDNAGGYQGDFSADETRRCDEDLGMWRYEG